MMGGATWAVPCPQGCNERHPHVHRVDPLGIESVEPTDRWPGDTNRSDDRINRVKVWWVDHARREAEYLAPKAVEYGSYDLELVGQVLADTIHPHAGADPDPEVGIAFYLLGKIARVMSAYRDGHSPSDDTFRDIAIYAKMVLYIRDNERWP